MLSCSFTAACCCLLRYSSHALSPHTCHEDIYFAEISSEVCLSVVCCASYCTRCKCTCCGYTAAAAAGAETFGGESYKKRAGQKIQSSDHTYSHTHSFTLLLVQQPCTLSTYIHEASRRTYVAEISRGEGRLYLLHNLGQVVHRRIVQLAPHHGLRRVAQSIGRTGSVVYMTTEIRRMQQFKEMRSLPLRKSTTSAGGPSTQK